MVLGVGAEEAGIECKGLLRLVGDEAVKRLLEPHLRLFLGDSVREADAAAAVLFRGDFEAAAAHDGVKVHPWVSCGDRRCRWRGRT